MSANPHRCRRRPGSRPGCRLRGREHLVPPGVAGFDGHGLCDRQDRWISGMFPAPANRATAVSTRTPPGRRPTPPSSRGARRVTALFEATRRACARRSTPASVRACRADSGACRDLLDHVPAGADADAVYTGFVEWALDQGLTLYPAAGRGDHRDRLRGERHPVHADRHGQVARRGRGARRVPRPRRAHVLHRADQGAREREVLRARRHLRGRERRHGDGRLVGQRRCADRLLHRRDPREPRAAPGRRCRRSTRS